MEHCEETINYGEGRVGHCTRPVHADIFHSFVVEQSLSDSDSPTLPDVDEWAV